MSDLRPVWISREEFLELSDAIDRCGIAYVERIGDRLLAHYRSAPADAAEAVGKALDQFKDTYDAWATGAMDEAVLRALGMPEASS